MFRAPGRVPGFLITKVNLWTWNIVGCQSWHPDSAFFQSDVALISDYLPLIIFLCFNFMISNCVYTNLASCLIARLTLYEDLSLRFARVFRIFVLFVVCARDPLTDFTIIKDFALVVVQIMTGYFNYLLIIFQWITLWTAYVKYILIL